MRIDKLTMNGESINFKIGIVKESPDCEAFKFLEINLTGKKTPRRVFNWCKNKEIIAVKCFVEDFCFIGDFFIVSCSTTPSGEYELTLMSSGLINSDPDISMKNADQPIHGHIEKAGDLMVSDGGLTKREYFAALAIQGILSNAKYEPPRRKRASGMAADAVLFADALLDELEK